MLLLTFRAAGEPYALDAAGVVELVPRVALRAVPHAPAHLAGLLGYRGGVVPVIDLGLLLGPSPSIDRLGTRIVLVKSSPDGQNRGDEPEDPDHTPRLLGLIAEQVIDLVEVGPDQIAPAPVHLAQAPYLSAIARIDRGFVPLISPSLLVISHQSSGISTRTRAEELEPRPTTERESPEPECPTY